MIFKSKVNLFKKHFLQFVEFRHVENKTNSRTKFELRRKWRVSYGKKPPRRGAEKKKDLHKLCVCAFREGFESRKPSSTTIYIVVTRRSFETSLKPFLLIYHSISDKYMFPILNA